MPAPQDVLGVMFTSGTTSAPKGVARDAGELRVRRRRHGRGRRLTAHDRQLVVLPMFHANAQYYSFASAISVGASVALMSEFSATRFVAQAARHGATHASLFAAPMRMILARGADAGPGLAGCATSGTRRTSPTSSTTRSPTCSGAGPASSTA